MIERCFNRACFFFFFFFFMIGLGTHRDFLGEMPESYLFPYRDKLAKKVSKK